MSKELKEILQEAYEDCITDKVSIEKIINNFMNLTFKEINDAADGDYERVLDDLLDAYNIDAKQYSEDIKGNIAYMDIACLADKAKMEEIVYVETDATGKVSGDGFLGRRLAISNICDLLKRAASKNLTVSRFFAVDVHSFFEYLEERKNNKVSIKNKNSLKKLLPVPIAEKTPIENVLLQAINMRAKVWAPWNPIAAYCSERLKAYEIMSILFIESFRGAYPERFHPEDIICGFGRIEQEDILEDSEDSEDLKWLEEWLGEEEEELPFGEQ